MPKKKNNDPLSDPLVLADAFASPLISDPAAEVEFLGTLQEQLQAGLAEPGGNAELLDQSAEDKEKAKKLQRRSRLSGTLSALADAFNANFLGTSTNFSDLNAQAVTEARNRIERERVRREQRQQLLEERALKQLETEEERAFRLQEIAETGKTTLETESALVKLRTDEELRSAQALLDVKEEAARRGAAIDLEASHIGNLLRLAPESGVSGLTSDELSVDHLLNNPETVTSLARKTARQLTINRQAELETRFGGRAAREQAERLELGRQAMEKGTRLFLRGKAEQTDADGNRVVAPIRIPDDEGNLIPMPTVEEIANGIVSDFSSLAAMEAPGAQADLRVETERMFQELRPVFEESNIDALVAVPDDVADALIFTLRSELEKEVHRAWLVQLQAFKQAVAAQQEARREQRLRQEADDPKPFKF